MAGKGRPKGSSNRGCLDGRIAARAHAEKAMQTLVDMLSSPSHPTRVSAASSILDRAFGRPAQAVEMSGPDGGPIQTYAKINLDPSKLSTSAMEEILNATANEE